MVMGYCFIINSNICLHLDILDSQFIPSNSHCDLKSKAAISSYRISPSLQENISLSAACLDCFTLFCCFSSVTVFLFRTIFLSGTLEIFTILISIHSSSRKTEKIEQIKISSHVESFQKVFTLYRIDFYAGIKSYLYSVNMVLVYTKCKI